jgi:hypothetical protein
MTSPRIAAANRRNARLSTGPRSATGKQTVARNAFRHALSIPVLADPDLAKDIVEWADRLADGAADPAMRELAVRFAEAQVDVERVRHARALLTARPAAGASVTAHLADRMPGELRQLVAIDRYEKLAVRRRRWATRAWQAARLDRIVAGEPAAPLSGQAADALRELEALAGQGHATGVAERKNKPV